MRTSSGNSACPPASRLTQTEINAVLKALRNLDRRERLNGEVVATAR